MCGICGIALKEGCVSEKLLGNMTAILRHRGPDGSGLYLDGNFGMGHRRLSIIDVAGGKQPMSNEDGSVWIAYNGEIYNHQEIRNTLIRSGHAYKTKSDTESIIHLHEEKREKAVSDLRGMFAYSLWDKKKRRLVLVRDRLGIKPLYYAFSSGNLVWASEIKSILRSGYVNPRVRIESIPEYLANRYVSGQNTMYEGIYRLLPGHILIWQDGQIRTESYWKLPVRTEHCDRAESIKEFRRLFEESVRLRLMSDVPLGMFLSGGIDSSAILSVMSKMSDRPVRTFSVAFSERDANELHYARLAAELFKTEHHEVIVSPDMFFSSLPALIWHEDEPIAFPSSIPLYFISELARNHVKVVLTGEGSDELLAGYAKYQKTILNMQAGRIYSRLPEVLRQGIRRKLSVMQHSSIVRQKLTRTFLYLEPDIESIYFDNFSVFSRRCLRMLLKTGIYESGDHVSPFRSSLQYYASEKGDVLTRILYTDIHTYLHELLMKQDQMSMAASIESRVPFLDHKLVEYVMGLPPDMKLNLRHTKFILRKSMRDSLPKEILYRNKMGFPVPISQWFRNGTYGALRESLLGDQALSRGYFNPDTIRTILNEHQAGVQNHSERIWLLLNFELWNRIFIDGGGNIHDTKSLEYFVDKNRSLASSQYGRETQNL